MRSASSTLLSIINDVLDISKIESGKFSIETTPFNLNETIRRTLSIFGEKAKQTNNRLTQTINEKGELVSIKNMNSQEKNLGVNATMEEIRKEMFEGDNILTKEKKIDNP